MIVVKLVQEPVENKILTKSGCVILFYITIVRICHNVTKVQFFVMNEQLEHETSKALKLELLAEKKIFESFFRKMVKLVMDAPSTRRQLRILHG